MTLTSTRFAISTGSRISKLMTSVLLLNLPFAVSSVAAAESLVITAPSAGQKFAQNSSLRVAWDSTGLTGDVDIRISVGDEIGTLLSSVPASSGSCTYYISNNKYSGAYYELLDGDGITRSNLLEFSDKTKISVSGRGAEPPMNGVGAETGFFAVAPPSVELLKPTQGDVFRVGDLLPMRWKSFGLNYPYVSLSISADGGATWTQAGFYLDDTGSFNLRVARDFAGDKTKFALNSPSSNDDFTLTYIGDLKFGHSYKIRLGAGASTSFGVQEGTFSILPAAAGYVSRQIIKARVGRRVHVKIQGLSGATSYRGKMPRGLKYKNTSHRVVGRPKRPSQKTIKFSDQRGGLAIVKFRIRASHAGPRPQSLVPKVR